MKSRCNTSSNLGCKMPIPAYDPYHAFDSKVFERIAKCVPSDHSGCSDYYKALLARSSSMNSLRHLHDSAHSSSQST